VKRQKVDTIESSSASRPDARFSRNSGVKFEVGWFGTAELPFLIVCIISIGRQNDPCAEQERPEARWFIQELHVVDVTTPWLGGIQGSVAIAR